MKNANFSVATVKVDRAHIGMKPVCSRHTVRRTFLLSALPSCHIVEDCTVRSSRLIVDCAVHTSQISLDGFCYDGRISILGRAHLREDRSRATPASRYCSLRPWCPHCFMLCALAKCVATPPLPSFTAYKQRYKDYEHSI